MNTKKVLFVFVTFIALVAIAIVGKIISNNVSASEPFMPEAGPTALTSEPIPTHIIYSHFFRQIDVMKKKAADAQQNGQNLSWLNSYFDNKAGLSATESSELDRIVEKCNQDTALLDSQARQIINNIRVNYPDGKLTNRNQLPPPPPELYELQRQRNETILNARDEIKTSFGESAFNEFDNFVQKTIKSTIRPINPLTHSPVPIPPAYQ